MTTDTTNIDPLTSFAAGSRKGFAVVLLACAVLFGVLGVFGFSKGLPALKGDSAKADDPNAPPEDAAKKPEKVNPWESISGGACGALAALAFASLGFVQFVGLPKATESERRADARAAILFAGGALGIGLMLFGAALFLCRIDALTDWLSLGKTKRMTPVLTAVAIALVGAVVAFLAVAPARAEERHNPTLRRLVYGTNAGLLLLVLLGSLVAFNVLVAVKWAGKLDTTETGFYSLDPRTKEYLAGLDQRVNVSFIALDGGDSRLSADTVRLLETMADANPAKVGYRLLNPVDNAKEIVALAAKYPTSPIRQEDGGILLTLGDDDKRFAFIPNRELVKAEGRGPTVFEGEGRVIRELLFLADNKQKTVVYVTQGSGELGLAPGPGRRAGGRTMTAVAEKLTQINCDVRPLAIDAKSPKVPDDANVVVVADPNSPLPRETIAALLAFANPIAPPGSPPGAVKKGKLLILSGAYPAADGKTLAVSGVEELLNPFGIVLGADQLYGEPPPGLTTQVTLMEVDPGSTSAVAKDFTGRTMYLPYARTVTAAPVPQSTQRVETLFTTKAGSRTFLSGPNPAEANQTWLELPGSPALQAAKKLSSDPRPVAAIVNEGTAPRAIVFGSGLVFSDQYMLQLRVESPVDLFAALVDTLRERPAVASLATKTYGTYTPPGEEQFTRMFWLPVLLVPLVVAAAGVGVWVVRRK